MTLPHVRLAPLTLTLAVLVLAAVPSGTATAQFFDPFSQFFAPQAPAYAPQYAPQAPVYSPPAVSRRGPRYSRRSRTERVWVPERAPVRAARDPDRVRHARVPIRIRHASLPDSAPVPKRRASEAASAQEKVRVEGKPKLVPQGPIQDPVAALLNDATLRRGDVVVLPDGPRVFKGKASTPHRLSDFEDVRRTKLVGAKTRRQLTALPIRSPAPRIQVETETAERLPDNQDRDQGQKVADQVTVTGSVPRHVGP
jgi:hypothetical protein